MKRALFHPLSVLLSWRYLLTRDVALMFVTKTSMLGLIVSITTLLVVQGIIAGFQRDLNRNVLGLVPHVTLSKPNGIDADLGERVELAVSAVTASAMVVQSSGLVSTSESVHRAQFIGVDPESISEFVASGNLDSDTLWVNLQVGQFAILLGSGLARELSVNVGDTVLVTLAAEGISPFGYMPRQKRFTVAGLAETQSSLDSLVAYINREDARRVLQMPKTANAAFFRLQNPLDVGNAFFSIYLAANDRDMFAATWQDLFGALFNFLQRFKNLLFLLLSMLVAVATFNLVSNMVMLVHSRRADIAVLRTLGGSTTTVLVSFVATAWVIALVSLVACIALAWLIGLILPTLHELLSQLIGVSLRDGFPLYELSVVLQLPDVMRVVGLTVLMVTLGSLYPAWRATRLAPSEILRDE
ncbi:MAG: ABC transporter permease [Gammaproteobacteria bacterium]|nr:ABC transporter permease [Gammaproteobacteria bacterium]